MAVRPTHFEFYSNDPEATVEMLTKAFGWGAERWGEEEYWLLDTGDGPGINGAVARSAEDGPKTMVTADVEDLDAALEAIRVSGGSPLTDVTEIPGVGRWAQILGPGGEVFGLMEPAAS